MSLVSKNIKPGFSLGLSIFLFALLMQSGVHADAGMTVITEGFSGSWVNGLSDDGSVAAGTLITGINEDFADDEVFIWNQTDGATPLGYLPLQGVSTAYGISKDGKRIFGRGNGDVFFSWTAVGSMQEVVTSGRLNALSDDGLVAVGHTILNSDPPVEAITSIGGTTTRLGILSTTSGYPKSTAWAVSSDGTVVVGETTSDLTASQSDPEAFRWIQSGMVGLGLDVEVEGVDVTQKRTRAITVSPSGDIIGGYSTSYVDSVWSHHIFIWTQATGMVSVMSSPNEMEIIGMSDDASVIVGRVRNLEGDWQHFRWTEARGMQAIFEWLSEAGIDTNPWTSASVTTVSADGNTIGGQLEDSNNGYNRRAFIAHVINDVVHADGFEDQP